MSKKTLSLEGRKAPQFTLPDQNGKKVSLKDFVGKQKVLLYFYPKDMTPGCTVESIGFSELKKALDKEHVKIFGISKDSVDRHKKFCEKESLTIDLLSDESGEVLEKYGVWKKKSMYGRTFLGISRESFLIDEKGVIVKHWPKVKPKDHPEEVLTFAKEHGK